MDTNSYFTVEILSSGNINLIMSSSSGTPITVYYWKNKEPNATKTDYDGSITTTTTAQNISNLIAGDKIKFYRAETTALSGSESNSWFNKLTGTSQFKVSGNIASLVGFSETLPEHCFRRLFYNSSTIIDAGELDLPWNTLSTECYTGMFYSCTNLTTGPSLPATTLADYCYQYMFRGCSSLTKAQRILPATTLVTGCYYWMFGGCSVLETAPELPALSLVSNCYYNLFGGCRALNYIKAMFTSTPGSGYTNSWVYNVSANGTFIKNSTATWTTSGQSGIPSGWTVKNMNQDTQVVDYQNIKSVYTKGRVPIKAIYAKGNILLWEYIYSDDYFTIQLLETGSFSWKMNGTGASYTIEYSKNGGEWTSITSDNNGVSISGVSGDRFRFKGLNDRYTKIDSTSYNTNYSFFDLTVRCNISGNIMSLINGNDFSGTSLTSSNTYAFYALFKPSDTTNGSKLISAEDLILPEASCRNCFEQMFYGSKNMIKGPKVIYVTDTYSSGNNVYCCSHMFKYCVLLEEAPELPSDYIPAGGFTYMFEGCTNLRYIKCLAIRSASSNITDWVNGVQTSSGLFIKATNSIINWSTGVNGIPANWTVVEE